MKPTSSATPAALIVMIDMSVILAYDHFFTGPFFRNATGSRDDIDYGYLMLQFNLAKTKLRASVKAP